MNEQEKHAAQTNYQGAENIRDLFKELVEVGVIGELIETITQDISHDVQPEMQREIHLEPER